MSSILRALRRLEADARSEEAGEPTLHEHVVFSRGRSRGPRGALALGALVAVVVCLGALGIAGARLLFGSDPAAEVATRGAGSRSATTRPAPARSSPDALRPSVAAHTLAAESSPRTRRVAAVAPPPVPRVPVAAVQAPPPPPAAALQAAPPPAAAVRTPSAPASAAVRTPPAPTGAVRGESAAMSEAPSAETSDPSAAVAAVVPQGAVARQAPPQAEGASASGAPVGVERILWHPSAEKRRAWLRVDGEDEAREVREGEQVGRYAVTRIDAGSVLFRSGSIELTRKLGADLP